MTQRVYENDLKTMGDMDGYEYAKSKYTITEENEAQLVEKDNSIAEDKVQPAEKDSIIAENKAQPAENKVQFAESDDPLIQLMIDEFYRIKANKEMEVDFMTQAVYENDLKKIGYMDGYECAKSKYSPIIEQKDAQLAENKAQLAEKDDEIAQLKAMLREALALLGVLTRNHGFEEDFNEIIFTEKDGEINMESAWQQAKSEAYNAGISIGEARGRDEAAKEYKNQLAALMAENERLKALLS